MDTAHSITPTDTLADLVCRLPAAARVFHRHQLDYCCGGRRSLDEACRAKALDPAAVAAQIEAEQRLSSPEEIDWSSRPLDELIDHIIARYHEPHRAELPRLLHLATKVEAVHAEKAGCPHGLAAHLAAIIEGVADHLDKEEQVLFPLIRQGHGDDCAMPVRCLIEEHEDHGRNLERTRELTADFVPPEAACGSWRALYQGLEQFEIDLMSHVHLENNILFPRALA